MIHVLRLNERASCRTRPSASLQLQSQALLYISPSLLTVNVYVIYVLLVQQFMYIDELRCTHLLAIER